MPAKVHPIPGCTVMNFEGGRGFYVWADSWVEKMASTGELDDHVAQVLGALGGLPAGSTVTKSALTPGPAEPGLDALADRIAKAIETGEDPGRQPTLREAVLPHHSARQPRHSSGRFLPGGVFPWRNVHPHSRIPLGFLSQPVLDKPTT